MRDLSFKPDAFKDYVEWSTTNKQVFKRINELLKDMLRNPLSGIGKPEVLTGNLRGFWSRRITDEHRLVYFVTETTITIVSCHGHY